MTLFMTSCGGKKSSRNCGRIRDTTRASLGKPFRILQRGNPPTRAEEQKVKLSVSDAVPLKYSTYLGDFPATEGHSRPMKLVFFCAYLSKSTETLSMATMMDSLSGAWGSEWAGRTAGLAFSLPEEKPTWPAVTPTASATAESTWPLTPVTSEPDVSTAERATRGWMESGGWHQLKPARGEGEKLEVVSTDTNINKIQIEKIKVLIRSWKN